MPGLISIFASAFIDILSVDARTALPYIESLTAQGIGANEVLRQVTAAGFKIQRSLGLQAVRMAKGIELSRDYLSSLKLNVQPNPARFPTALTEIRRNYSYSVRITGFDTYTGQTGSRYVTVSTNSVLTKQQALDMAEGILLADPTTYPITDYTLAVHTVKSNPVEII